MVADAWLLVGATEDSKYPHKVDGVLVEPDKLSHLGLHDLGHDDLLMERLLREQLGQQVQDQLLVLLRQNSVHELKTLPLVGGVALADEEEQLVALAGEFSFGYDHCDQVGDDLELPQNSLPPQCVLAEVGDQVGDHDLLLHILQAEDF